MAFATPSDPLLALAFYSGIAVCVITGLLLSVIASLRYLLDAQKRRRDELAELWYPVLFHTAENIPCTLPPLARRDREQVALLWINFSETLRGEARDRLGLLAEQIGMRAFSRLLLRQSALRRRLMGVVIAGRLQDRDLLPELSLLLDHPNSMLSLFALRSILQIDCEQGLAALLVRMAVRDDWPLARVLSMLEDVPQEMLAPTLLAGLNAAEVPSLPRVLPLLAVVHVVDWGAVLAPFLEEAQPTEVLVAALRLCTDPQVLQAVRLLCLHPNWVVRAQAASTLGRIGEAQDRYRLQALLTDGEWWVRYRAATSLANFPGMSLEHLKTLCRQFHDRFATDILNQVMAERQVGANA